MAILVLGGAGYIGSHLVRELISAGRDVVVADNLATGFQQAVHPKARFYRTDIRDRAGLDHLFQREQIEGVIHFAAYSQVGESMQNPLKYYNNNLGGTITLLESMIAHDVKRIVFSSTAAVYGIPDRCPIPESDRTEPINPYGETKRKITGHPIPAEIAPKRDGDPAELVASSEKARTVLGWKPKLCDIETIVSSAWKWHQSHPDGYGLK